jgi:Cdc6-like AAA superfamily ATPase
VKVRAVTKLGKTKELLANLLRSLKTTYILLDGLDECADKDQKQILMELSNLIPADSKAKENSPKLKILVCSRETKEIARKLNKVPQISLTNEDRYVSQDIASFVKSSLAELKDRFQNNTVDEIQDIVVKKADDKIFSVFSALL